MSSILDEAFPYGARRKAQAQAQALRPPPTNERPWAEGLREQGTTIKPKRKKTKSQKLGTIGEGLAKLCLSKIGVSLTKIPLIEAYYGYKSIDVDFRDEARRVKVEAKAWWTKGGKNSFPLSRFSDNERRYMREGIVTGFKCWITIALLDGEPTRSACNAVYVIPWTRWLEIEAQLSARAAGNYKGLSLRVRDLDLLEGYAIVREGRRWVIPAGHWLNEEVER